MIYKLLQTDADYITLFLRVIAGIIIFPYGMQKLLGWFDNLGGGVGIKETLIQLNTKKIPTGRVTQIYFIFRTITFLGFPFFNTCYFRKFSSNSKFSLIRFEYNLATNKGIE